MRHLRAATAAMIMTFAFGTALVFAWSGGTNGSDATTGQDSPGATGSYSVDNRLQDGYLSEWDEPSHDWARDRYNMWSQAVYNNVLVANKATKALGWQLSIINQNWYNYVNTFNTNLPFTKAPENENPLEEAAQGYTEVDTEIKDPSAVDWGVFYFIDYKIDSEQKATSNGPTFETEIEWCNKTYTTCNFDVTGVWTKSALVQ
jgi:hypothetical protein